MSTARARKPCKMQVVRCPNLSPNRRFQESWALTKILRYLSKHKLGMLGYNIEVFVQKRWLRLSQVQLHPLKQCLAHHSAGNVLISRWESGKTTCLIEGPLYSKLVFVWTGKGEHLGSVLQPSHFRAACRSQRLIVRFSGFFVAC